MNESNMQMFTISHSLEPKLPSAIKDLKKYNSYQIECFLKKWICI